jgi:hypothetical protein
MSQKISIGGINNHFAGGDIIHTYEFNEKQQFISP